MSHINEVLFLRNFVAEFPPFAAKHLEQGRILNVGSANCKFTAQYHKLFPGREFCNVDMGPGPEVDIVCDMTGDCKELRNEKFAAVICASVLEHCEKPWLMAANIEQHMLPEALIYVAIPWIWRTHEYPKDYWRMTPDAVSSIFPNVKWKAIGHSIHSRQAGEFIYHQNHDNVDPWRVMRGDRVYLASQELHMVGRRI